MECIHCKVQIERTVPRCPRCKLVFPLMAQRWFFGIVGAICCFFGMYLLIALSSVPSYMRAFHPELENAPVWASFMIGVGACICVLAFRRLGVTKSLGVVSNSRAQSQDVVSENAIGAKVHITSSPSGAEILVDDKFVGCTPSDIVIASGEHTLRVTLNGREWSRTLSITTGEVTLHADLAQAAGAP
jgi:hypothetical protein